MERNWSATGVSIQQGRLVLEVSGEDITADGNEAWEIEELMAESVVLEAASENAEARRGGGHGAAEGGLQWADASYDSGTGEFTIVSETFSSEDGPVPALREAWDDETYGTDITAGFPAGFDQHASRLPGEPANLIRDIFLANKGEVSKVEMHNATGRASFTYGEKLHEAWDQSVKSGYIIDAGDTYVNPFTPR